MIEGSELESLSEFPQNHELTRENIKLYMRGCEEMAARLDSTIDKVIDSGRRPLVLIPSRGAVPIFLQARRILNDLDPENSHFTDGSVNYYPNGVFDFLENVDPKNNTEEAKVDVVLYPFTADVSVEGEEEHLAKRLRASCARAVLQLVSSEKTVGKKDLEWYQFIMRKMSDNPDEHSSMKPKQILQTLKELPKDQDYQIILIDTVISGRAAHDITTAFQTLDPDNSVVPILAVDNIKGGKFQQRRRAEIEAAAPFDLVDAKGPFVDFPLISEDKGSALLGLCAVNFSNFNNPGEFSRVSTKFPQQFLPQSCVWTLPPNASRVMYLETFRKFLDVSWRIYQNEQISDEEMASLQKDAKALTAGHSEPTQRELASLFSLSEKPEAKETASHIISVKLPPSVAQDWIKEFAGKE